MTRLEKINFDYGPNARSGWVTRTLHMGNIPFDAIFESLDELFQSKVRCFCFLLMYRPHTKMRFPDTTMAH